MPRSSCASGNDLHVRMYVLLTTNPSGPGRDNPSSSSTPADVLTESETIPRTPTPEPLEDRDFESLSREDFKELHERAKAAKVCPSAYNCSVHAPTDTCLSCRRKRQRSSRLSANVTMCSVQELFGIMLWCAEQASIAVVGIE